MTVNKEKEKIYSFLVQGLAAGNSSHEVRLLLQSLFYEEPFVKIYEVSIVRELDIDIPSIGKPEK